MHGLYMKKEKPDINHPCNGCHYWRDAGVCYACHYLLVEGHSRGCAVGTDCSCRIPYDNERYKREVAAMLYSAACV